MRIKFRPMPWLTVLTLICLGILISLGTWQYQRLGWKTNLIAEIDAAAEAAPITSLKLANELLENNEPLDFRRVSLSGEFVQPSLNNAEPFHLIMPDGKSLNWRLIQPYVTEQGVVFVATHEFTNAQKANPPAAEIGSRSISGYARLIRKSSKFAPISDPVTNHWYVFNADPEAVDWAHALQDQIIPTAYYIDWVDTNISASELPVRKPELRNHHLDYMLTWYSFALILLIIYIILHRRQGRLQFRD